MRDRDRDPSCVTVAGGGVVAVVGERLGLLRGSLGPGRRGGPAVGGSRGRPRVRAGVGWVAVGLLTLVSVFWAFWGGIEAFYEGWYHPSLAANLGLTVVQYLSPMLAAVGLAVVAIRWPRIGAASCAAVAVALAAGLPPARPGRSGCRSASTTATSASG